METKETVVKTKTKMWDGKAYTIELTESQLEEMRHDADVCKLNGYDFDYFMNEFLTRWKREDWPEVAAEVFAESNPELKVGLGATMNLWSDHRAMTIVEVVSPKKIIVQENETECLDYYGGRYKVLDSIAEYMGKHTFTLRKNGKWVEEGQPKKFGSVTLTVGFRRHYIDPSF
jgi:hypothetical protein